MPKRVLIIEDDPATRDVLAAALSAQGYYVSGLDRSPGALDAVRAQRPDLVLTDVMMPEVDGVQVITRLRGAGYTGPLLVVTALRLPDTRLAGADAVLGKPFELETLQATVRQLLEADHAPAQ